MVRDAGLEITLFQPFRDFEGMPEPQRSRTFDRAERKFDLMQEMGSELMLICSSVSPLALGGIDRAAADLSELGEHAAKRGLRVGYEALAWGRHVSDHRDAWEIVRRADQANVGLILDSFHTLAKKTDVDSIRSIPGDRIFIVQLADAPLLDMDLLSWSRHFRNMPGQGDLPLADFMAAVMATGYRGTALAGNLQRPVPWRLAEVDLGRWPPLPDQPDGPGKRRAEPALADRPPAASPIALQAEGIEFVEFAANEEEAEGSRPHVPIARLRAGRAACLEGCHRLAPGRRQSGDQHRARGFRPFLLHRARNLRLRHRSQGRGRGRHGRTRACAWGRRPSTRRPVRASSGFRRSAASAAG